MVFAACITFTWGTKARLVYTANKKSDSSSRTTSSNTITSVGCAFVFSVTMAMEVCGLRNSTTLFELDLAPAVVVVPDRPGRDARVFFAVADAAAEFDEGGLEDMTGLRAGTLVDATELDRVVATDVAEVLWDCEEAEGGRRDVASFSAGLTVAGSGTLVVKTILACVVAFAPLAGAGAEVSKRAR